MVTRDELMRTAKTFEELMRDTFEMPKRMPSSVSGVPLCLPAPYNRVKNGDPQEREIQREIKDELKKWNISNWRIEGGGKIIDTAQGKKLISSEMTGMSDLVCCVPPHGRFLAIEVKRPGGSLSPAQVSFLLSVRHSGGIACVGVSANIVSIASRYFDGGIVKYIGAFPFLIG